MKKYLLILFAAGQSMVFGQSRSVNKNIQDDGKSISVHFSGTINGQTINYDHTFDLSFLDKPERLALGENILDSPDISFPPAPEAPLFSEGQPEPVMLRKEYKTAVSKRYDVDQNQNTDKKQNSFKEVKYNAEGEMYLHYRFIKNGEDFEYERTLNVRGKSERERQLVVTETEQEIGFSPLK